MKYFVAVALSVLAALKPQEASLTHGITCVFTADEENGSANGLPRLLENESIRRELSNRTVLNEGGGFAYEYDGRWYSLVETGQKSVCRLTVTVPELPSTNPYFPTLDHEVVLSKAIRAVESVDVPAAVPETARELLGRFAGSRGAAQTQVGPGRDAAGEANEGAAISAGLERVRASGDEFMYKLLYAMTHSMTTPTIVRGGSRNPELPRTTKASVTFDCRLLPSVTRGEFEQAVRASLAELPVELTVSSFSQGYETAFTNPIISRAEAALRRHDPRVEACLPFITPGSNDGKYLRPLGCDILGFAPLATSQPFKEVISMIHGINERISLESVTLCTDVMTEICSSYVQGKEDDAQQ
jgi:acetylornithine deacetylase/succinyl-diaminopimelate desuccinylase-like protein